MGPTSGPTQTPAGAIRAASGSNYAVIPPNDTATLLSVIQTANTQGTLSAPYQIVLSSGDYFFSDTNALSALTGVINFYGNNTTLHVPTNQHFDIRQSASVEFHNVKLINDSSLPDAFYYGGLMVINGLARVLITDSVLQSGHATNGAGAISDGGQLTLQRVQFLNNRAGGGAAIQVDTYGSLTASCVTFSGNAGTYGRSILAGTQASSVSVVYGAFLTQTGPDPQDVYNFFADHPTAIDKSYWGGGTPQVSANVTVTNNLVSNPNDPAAADFQEVCRIRNFQLELTATVTLTRTFTPTPSTPSLRITITADNLQPIPRLDMVTFTVKIDNISSNSVTLFGAHLMWMAPNPLGPNDILMTYISSIPSNGLTLGSNFIDWTQLNISILANASTSFQIKFRTQHSGDIQLLFDARSANGSSLGQGNFTLSVPVTLIPLTTDPRFKSLIFWMIFHESSEGGFENSNLHPLGNSTTTPPPPNQVNSSFLTMPKYCVRGSIYPGQNEEPSEQPGVAGGWETNNILYMIHCTNFAYLESETVINGLINYERRNGTALVFYYATSNFKGSLGDVNASIWKETKGCKKLDQRGNPVSNQPLGAYANVSGRNSSQYAQNALDWLYAYRYCKVSTPSSDQVQNGRWQIYQDSNTRFMAQIDAAINDFATNPTYDLSNGAFGFKAANRGSVSISTCVGGCTNGAYNIRPISLVAQQNTIDYYPVHIQAVKNDYGPDIPTMLQPVLWSERRKLTIKDSYGNDIPVGYVYDGYRWVTVSYQQPSISSEEDRRHIPR